MREERKPIGKDASGFEILAQATKSLLNQFPGLNDGEVVKFEELGDESGIAFSADNGALVFAQRTDVLDNVYQECRFPFYIVYRTTSTKERQKMSIQEFLDQFGKWVCREPVEINGVMQRLTAWPKLKGKRKITGITRDNSYGLDPQENGVQDWVLPVSIQYTNEFNLEGE